MRTKCERDIHRFVPRYDEIEMDHGSLNVKSIYPKDFRELLVRRVYVHDICRRCGKTIKREGLNE